MVTITAGKTRMSTRAPVQIPTAATVKSFLADPNASARESRDTGIGVNWYFNRNFKIQVNYDQTKFHGGAAGGADQPTEKALFTRFQANF